MSTDDLHDGEFVHVNRYCGPPQSIFASRLRYQLTAQQSHERGTYVQLSLEGLRELADVLPKIIEQAERES